MSDIDLTEAKAVAYRVYCESQHRGPMGDDDFEAALSRIEEAWMSTAVAAAAPLIAAQVRAQVAAKIEAKAHKSYIAGSARDQAARFAARIARGESS